MNRSAFLASSASLAALARTPAAAQPVPGGSHFVERKADFNEAQFAAAVGKPADIRQVWEVVSFHPQVLNNVKNALNGLQFGFGYAADRIAMTIAAHGQSSAYTYTEYLWQKYSLGTAFKLKDAHGNALTTNTFLTPSKAIDQTAGPDDETSVFQDTSIDTLQRRGVVFLTCHTAVEEQARALVAEGFAPAGMTAARVADDMLSHLITGTHVVPAMVGAIAVLQQRFHYSYITVTFA